MKHTAILLSAFCLMILAGCASTTQKLVDNPNLHFADQAFPGFRQVEIESEEEVFALDDYMRDFVDKHTFRIEDPKQRIKKLVAGIFDRSHMNLLYVSDANTSARDTFHNRSANCLSMSIMTYALADYAGMDVSFQDVQVPEFWTRRGGFSLMNGHINLRVMPRNEHNTTYVRKGGMEVDFDPMIFKVRFPSEGISKRRVLAMYYNNKAADFLVRQNYAAAYAYVRSALVAEPNLSEAWVNLGVLYRHNEMLDEAEGVYNLAISINDNRSAQENLAFVYRMTGRDEQAEAIMAYLQTKRTSNPFYHYMLGQEELDQKHYQDAIEHFREAIRLNRNQHEFYYALAKTYYQMGDLVATERYLRLAKRRAIFDQDEDRYQNKINLLTQL